MKKHLLFPIFILFTTIAFAQSSPNSRYKIGFKVNPNVSWFNPNTNNLTSDGSRLHFGFALNFDKMFTTNYAFGTGLNIFTTGGKLSYMAVEYSPDGKSATVNKVSRSYNLQYGEIPLTLKLRTNEVGYMTFWGQFGLGIGVNIGAKADETVDLVWRQDTVASGNGFASQWRMASGNVSTDENKVIKDDIQFFRASLIVGGGIEYNLSGSTSLLAGITFNNGFSNILSSQAVKVKASGSQNFVTVDGKTLAPVLEKLTARSNFIEFNIGIIF